MFLAVPVVFDAIFMKTFCTSGVIEEGKVKGWLFRVFFLWWLLLFSFPLLVLKVSF